MPQLRSRGACALTLAIAAFACASTQASPVWLTPWLADAPPIFTPGNNGYSPRLIGVAFADDGDVVLASNGFYSQDASFVTRFGADGTLRWSGTVAPYADPAAIVPLADGGAYATFSYYGIAGFAARLDANGATLWARDISARAIAPIDDARVAIADCATISMLDAATGVVIWNRVLAHSSGCDGGLVADANTLYTIATQSYAPAPGTRLVALDLDGHVRWQVTLDASNDAALVGASGGQLYVHSNGETLAIRESNGSLAWRAPGSGWTLGGAAHEAIVTTGDGIARLAAEDGHVRWTAAATPFLGPFEAVGDSIVAVDGTSAQQLVRIDAESGAVVWRSDLPVPPSKSWYYWTALGGLAANGTFPIIARTDTSAFVQRVDYATGALASGTMAPAVTQRIQGNALRDGNDLVSMHSDYSDVLRLIDVDAATGAVRWNVAPSLNVDDSFSGSLQWQSAHAVGPSRVAAVVPMNTADNTAGLIKVVALDRTSGSVAWNVTLFDDGESQTSVATPIVDDADNVIVSVLMTVRLWDGTQQLKKSIYKLAALDGAVLWRVDDPAPADQPFQILALGNDVLVRGRFDGSNATLRRLDGSDGSVRWSSDLFADTGIIQLYSDGDSRIVAFATTAGPYTWAALDATTGTMLWSSTAPCPAGAYCGGFNGALAPNGDIVLPIISDTNAAVVRLAGDGSGAVTSWPIAPADAVLNSSLAAVGIDDDGTIDLDWAQYGSWMGGAGWFVRLDTASGAASFQGLVGLPMGVPDGDSLLLDVTTAYAREDMTVTAHGNLAASVTLDQSEISPGEHLGFHLIATYAGDAPITGVSLRGNMRWPSGVTELACGGAGVSNCVLDATGTDVVATFDIAPGGRLEITGKILALDDPSGVDGTRYIGVRVRGPAGLVETVTADNFARASALKVLFANGFDG